MSSADAGLLEDPAVKLLAQVHQITPAQLLLHWGMSRGYSVIPRSSSALHIEEIAHCRIADAAKHAIAASEWSTLDCITQHRQIDGTDLLLADSAQTGPDAICSLAELWEEEKEEKEAAAAEEAAA
jgi:diketogulonate reductase-like aldo/keto reductase